MRITPKEPQKWLSDAEAAAQIEQFIARHEVKKIAAGVSTVPWTGYELCRTDRLAKRAEVK